MHLELLTAAHETRAREYLEHAPYDNVFLLDLLSTEPDLRARGRLYIAIEGGAVRGVAFFGRQFVMAAESDAIPEFAKMVPRFRTIRMLVGPREQIIAFWKVSARYFPQPRIVRDRQYVMVVKPETLRHFSLPNVRVRRAHADEWAEIADNSAEMITNELGYDPRTRGDFGAGVRYMIANGVWWIGECMEKGTWHYCFFCHVGPESRRTAQLQGIWTPPPLRGKGLATAAFTAICRGLLEKLPSLSLYVNDFNEPAIRLYERIGFKKVGEFQTILL